MDTYQIAVAAILDALREPLTCAEAAQRCDVPLNKTRAIVKALTSQGLLRRERFWYSRNFRGWRYQRVSAIDTR